MFKLILVSFSDTLTIVLHHSALLG